MRIPATTPRQGLTLLEVIVAMAIFLFSVVALQQLVSIGSERALDVSLQTRTSFRCQAKMSEIMIGAEKATSSGYTSFTDFDKDLQWKCEVAQGDVAVNLWTVKVSVKAELPTGKIVESHLCQMMLDPSVRGTTMDQATTTTTTMSTTTP